MITQQPLNIRPAKTPGTGRPVCESCGASTRAAVALTDGRISVWDLPAGWSSAPYPEHFVNADGSTGTTYLCPRCQTRSYTPKLDRR